MYVKLNFQMDENTAHIKTIQLTVQVSCIPWARVKVVSLKLCFQFYDFKKTETKSNGLINEKESDYINTVIFLIKLMLIYLTGNQLSIPKYKKKIQIMKVMLY